MHGFRCQQHHVCITFALKTFVHGLVNRSVQYRASRKPDSSSHSAVKSMKKRRKSLHTEGLVLIQRVTDRRDEEWGEGRGGGMGSSSGEGEGCKGLGWTNLILVRDHRDDMHVAGATDT